MTSRFDPRTARLIDPGDTSGLEKFLLARQWKRHPSFANLFNRDGGSYESAESAARIEREEQKARDLVKELRVRGSDEELIRREIRERRDYDLGRSARAEQKVYDSRGHWGIVADPEKAAARSRVK